MLYDGVVCVKLDNEEQYAKLPLMPRPTSDNTVPINMKVSPEWIALADRIASSEKEKGLVRPTRTAVMRAALEYGLEMIAEKRGLKLKKK